MQEDHDSGHEVDSDPELAEDDYFEYDMRPLVIFLENFDVAKIPKRQLSGSLVKAELCLCAYYCF